MENIFLALSMLSLGAERFITGYPPYVTGILCIITGILMFV